MSGLIFNASKNLYYWNIDVGWKVCSYSHCGKDAIEYGP